MAVIYLTHPIHGAKVAISNDEAIYDEEFGWTRYDPEAEADEAVNTLAPQRRGRRAVTQEG